MGTDMAPDDERLGSLIGAAFDRLAEPAPARLKAVEERLVLVLGVGAKKRRTPGWYWWLAATVVASGAAAWWAVGYDLSSGPETPMPAVPAPPAAVTERTGPGPRERVESPPPNESAQTRGSVIYRRER